MPEFRPYSDLPKGLHPLIQKLVDEHHDSALHLWECLGCGNNSSTGLHHMAFEYDSFDDLMSSFARLKQLGIEPGVCVQRGVTTSLYYSDPDQNAVELQVDKFGNWNKSTEGMSTSEAFR